MKKLLGMVTVVGLTVPSFAQSPDFSSIDTDQNGGISFVEAQAALPEVTEEQFQAADADQNGELSEEEFLSLSNQ